MRGILPPNVHQVDDIVEAKQAFYINNPAGFWHCTRCQAEIEDQRVIYRMFHSIGLNDAINKPNCPRCGQNFTITRPFQECRDCFKIFMSNRDNILDGLVYNVGSSFQGFQP